MSKGKDSVKHQRAREEKGGKLKLR